MGLAGEGGEAGGLLMGHTVAQHSQLGTETNPELPHVLVDTSGVSERGGEYLYCRALSMYSCCSIMTESAAETSMMILRETEGLEAQAQPSCGGPDWALRSSLLGRLGQDGGEERLLVCPG